MSSGYVFYLLDRTKVEHQQRTYVSFECRPHEYFEVQQSIDSREISRLSYDEIDEIHDVEKGLRFSSSKQNLAFELHKSSLSEEDYLIFRNYLHNRVNERN